MAHLGEKIEVDNKRDIERAVTNEYGIITIVGEVGKLVAKNASKKYYEGGVTAGTNWINYDTEDVIGDVQSPYYAIAPALPGCIVTRNDLREYTGAVDGETLVLTHKRNTVA